ncbi:hypothetical protein BDY19DRAFT_908566 [Irpex rosettiformis]|uniref:Uncharacterized protein n=1 Tax=Irpex rosettiformis TaxID=378272 RepID=A0ACB8TVE7_9APHY|nr:hypothetical protein BDY19DRAFT_908566 [Irpex rosettiformis]
MGEEPHIPRPTSGDSDSEDEADAYKPTLPQDIAKEDESDEEHCSICLQPLSDRTIVPACSHEFCFECLLVWTEQSRKCPLCSGQIGEYLIHDIRSKYDFSKHYLNPLRTSPRLDPSVSRVARAQNHGRRREVVWGRNERRERERERRAADELERAIEKRRWIYRHGLYAKHVASNPYTRYKPFPTPVQFSSNPDLISRATIFVRRELRVWDALDVEFLTTFTISLMKSIDIRSESAVKLLAEFLDMDTGERTNAEHFAHELYCYLRSPYKDLARYDAAVQYDAPEHVPAVEYRQRSSRWTENISPRSPSISGHARTSHTHSRSPTWSHTQQESRDVVREMAISRECNKRPQSRSPEVNDSHLVEVGDNRRQSIDRRHQDEPAQDIKGKARAVGLDGNADFPRQPSHRRNSPSAAEPLQAGASQRPEPGQDQGDFTVTEPLNGTASMVEQNHEALNGKQKGRPKVRREALQAMNAHLLDSSHGHQSSKPVIGREQQPLDTPRDEMPPPAELSIRGAAQAASGPLFPSDSFRESNCQSVHDTTRVATGIQGMSSRDIMARTRARLAKLRQDSTLSTTTTSPKRGEHDELGLNPSSKFPSIPHFLEDGNHTTTAPSSSNCTSSQLVAQAYDASAAQSSHPDYTHTDSDVGGATSTAAILRARLLRKLEDEKREHDDGKTDDPNRPETYVVPVTVEGTQFETSLLPDNIGGSKQAQTEEMSFGRQDAEMLEKKLRGQAQLRIKLAAAKRHLHAGTAVESDEMSGADRNPMSREDYLRSRLKRAV